MNGFEQIGKSIDNLCNDVIDSYNKRYISIVDVNKGFIEEEKDIKKKVSIMMECYIELSNLIQKYLISLETAKNNINRYKGNSIDVKWENIHSSHEIKHINEFILAANEIGLSVPSSIVCFGEEKKDLLTFQIETMIAQKACEELSKIFKGKRKELYTSREDIEDIVYALHEEGYFYFDRSKMNRLQNQALISALLKAFHIDENEFRETLEDCNRKYEEHEKERLRKRKEADRLALENRKKELEYLSISKEKMDKITVEQVEEIEPEVLSVTNEWLDMLRNGTSIQDVLNILSSRNHILECNQFYESLLNEKDFLENILLKEADEEEETKSILMEKQKYEYYISMFESYFLKEKEEVEHVHENTLIFATRKNGNAYFDPTLENISGEFKKKSVENAIRVLKYGSREQIFRHVRNLNTYKDHRDFYEYKTYQTRILFRPLKENAYFIIYAFEKKCNLTKGYLNTLEHFYSDTNLEFDRIKKGLEQDEIKDSYKKQEIDILETLFRNDEKKLV